MRILVTGATGLIGGDAARALVSADMEVIGVVRSSEGSETFLTVNTLVLDLRQPDAIRALIRCEPDVLVHAAAVLPVRFEGSDAVDAARANREIDDVVLAAAASLRRPLVFLSSTSLYGCVQTACDEAAPVSPRGAYGWEKYRSEGKVLERDARSVVLRVSAPYGSRQRTQTVLRRFVMQASRGEDLCYFGSGAREQDFTAVEDVSAAIVAAVGATSGGVFNVASGKPISMRDLARLVVETVGSATSRVRPADAQDPEELCRANIVISKAERELGWRPRVDLQAAIRRLARDWAALPGMNAGSGRHRLPDNA